MFSVMEAILAGLRRRYAEPHRAYHGQAHVDALLAGLAAEERVGNPAAIELAIWFHDAVYDPAVADNEARSADLLRTELAGLADPALLSAADAMIRASAGHQVPPGLPAALRHDLMLFLDLDMAVLGAAAPAYDTYEAGIAAEYVPVHGAARFRLGRAAFLRGMLERERLFHTEAFHRRCHQAARDNMRRALRRLERAGNSAAGVESERAGDDR